MITRFLLIVTFAISAFLTAESQKTHISIDIKNYQSDSIVFGYYLADKMLVQDTLTRIGNAPFVYEQDTLLPMGMYIIVSMPEGMFYQVIVDEDQEFEVVIDTTSQNEIIVTGSEENQLFYDYMTFVNIQRAAVSNIDKALVTTDSTQISIRDQLLEDRYMINQGVQVGQQRLIEEYPESIVAILLKANIQFEFPEFEGTEESIQTQKYHYYKEHYFDQIDLKHPAILRTPICHQRIEYYEESLTPKMADSTIQTVDYLLGLMKEDSEIYRYYLSYYLNKYANSKYIGMDAAYVHLALNYYGKGKASWVSEENKKEIVTNAKRLAPVLIGKQAPDFKVTKKDGSSIVLSELENEYTVVVFWKPSCGHCTKAMPFLVDFQKKYRNLGVEVVTICTEKAKKIDDCWDAVKEKGMEDLTNGVDLNGRNRTQSRYYATSTPMIYIIDKNQEIKLKKLPAENLGAIMDQVFEQDAAEKKEGVED